VTIAETTFPADGNIKLSQTLITLTPIEWIPVYTSVFWKWEVPPEEKDTIFIVSHIVCQQNPRRQDFYIVWWKLKDYNNNIKWASYLVPNPYYEEA